VQASSVRSDFLAQTSATQANKAWLVEQSVACWKCTLSHHGRAPPPPPPAPPPGGGGGGVHLPIDWNDSVGRDLAGQDQTWILQSGKVKTVFRSINIQNKVVHPFQLPGVEGTGSNDNYLHNVQEPGMTRKTNTLSSLFHP
jgi:hypothetical protein